MPYDRRDVSRLFGKELRVGRHRPIRAFSLCEIHAVIWQAYRCNHIKYLGKRDRGMSDRSVISCQHEGRRFPLCGGGLHTISADIPNKLQLSLKKQNPASLFFEKQGLAYIPYQSLSQWGLFLLLLLQLLTPFDAFFFEEERSSFPKFACRSCHLFHCLQPESGVNRDQLYVKSLKAIIRWRRYQRKTSQPMRRIFISCYFRTIWSTGSSASACRRMPKVWRSILWDRAFCWYPGYW